MAGDAADRTIIGFSPDARFFAFTEHGIQDGSGFPYATGYVIDSSTDTWLKGTPIRVTLESEAETVDTAVSQLMERFGPVADEYSINVEPEILAHNPISQFTGDAHETRFVRRLILPVEERHTYRVILEERPLEAKNCPADMGDPYMGMTLKLTSPSGEEITLVEDTEIPASRRCPLGYRISEVLAAPGSDVLAILVDVMSLGFEGPDRRFMAVTARLPEAE